MRNSTPPHRPLALLAVLAPVGLLTLEAGCIATRRGGPVDWEAWASIIDSSDAAMSLATKAETIESHLLDNHLSPEGLLVYRRPYTPFDPARSDSYQNLSDQTMWTGALVATYAYAFRVTGDPAHRELLLRALGGLELLLDVTGHDGLFARSAMPESVPLQNPDDGVWESSTAMAGWRYRGDVSKDQYFGVLFGCAAVAVCLPDDAEARSRAGRVAAAVADHIRANGGIRGPDGDYTSFGKLRAWIPIVHLPNGVDAGLLLGFPLVAWRLTGEARFADAYQDLVSPPKHYDDALRWTKIELIHPRLAWRFWRWTWFYNRNNDNMALMALYALANLDDDAARRAKYEGHLARHWETISDEANGFWNAIHASRRPLEGHVPDDTRRNLRAFPTDPRLAPFDFTNHPAARELTTLDRFDRPQNASPLPISSRSRADFLWKHSAYALRGRPGEDVTTEPTSGSLFEYLLAYWMLRAHAPEVVTE